jgi:hypothetical protein
VVDAADQGVTRAKPGAHLDTRKDRDFGDAMIRLAAADDVSDAIWVD